MNFRSPLLLYFSESGHLTYYKNIVLPNLFAHVASAFLQGRKSLFACPQGLGR